MTESAALAYFEGILADVECPPFEFEVEQHGPLCFLQAKLWRLNIHTQEWGYGYSARYLLSVTMEVGEIVKKAFVAARDFAEHEIREGFLWKGRPILGPHVDLDKLWEAVGEDGD